MCKQGRKKGFGQATIKCAKKKSRRIERELLKKATLNPEICDYIPTEITVPYTD